MAEQFISKIKYSNIDYFIKASKIANSLTIKLNGGQTEGTNLFTFDGSTALNSNALNNCYHLTGTVNATYNPRGSRDCYIYVPRANVSALKSATNWSKYANQIRALEDYTVDGTTTGDLDETKI